MDKVKRMQARPLWRRLAALAFLLPLGAVAQVAFTTQAVNVRAGPDRGFPLVTWLQAGTAVNLIGCIDGWRWCDVVVGFNRGWVYARYLSMRRRNQSLLILHNGRQLGIPLVTFTLGPYWDSHYRNRPWWNDRNDWARRPPPPVWHAPPPHRPPPRPPTSHPRPPRAEPPPFGPPPAGRPPSGGRPSGRSGSDTGSALG